MAETERLEETRENNIVAGDLVNGQLVLKRYDGSEIRYGEIVDADPHITSLSPNSVAASAGSTTINVNGEYFEDGAEIEIDQVAVPTTFVSSTQLTTEYDPTVPGAVEVTVRQDPHESNSVTLTVT